MVVCPLVDLVACSLDGQQCRPTEDVISYNPGIGAYDMTDNDISGWQCDQAGSGGDSWQCGQASGVTSSHAEIG
eukprot:1566011-Pyramimonas_sp.AAC.1